MTTQYAVFSGLPTGLTLTKKVFTVADPDTEVTGITGANTERTNAKGEYVITITKSAVITGIHTIILFVGSTPIATGSRTFAGTDGETATVTPETAVLDSASVTAVQSGLALESTSQAVMTRLGAPAGASVSADVAAVKSDTASLLSRLTANAATAIQNLWHMITGTGASSKFTVAALENGPTGAGGSGDWTDTEKEQIRYRLGLDGDTSAPADPDTDPIVVTPGSGDLTTGYTTTLGTDGEAIEGIFVRWRLVDVPTGTGLALDSSASEAESDSNGLVQLAGLVKGATYLIWRGTNERDGITVTIPTDASSTYELPNIAGP